jgi:tetratricopeptide (TPR) repeat protein
MSVIAVDGYNGGMLMPRTRVAIGRALAPVAPRSFGPLLIGGLVWRAWHTPIGPPRYQRRLDWAAEAVALSRRLVAAAPGRHERLLARALVVQARRLASLKRYPEALAACDEAEEIDARWPAPAGDALGPGGGWLVRADVLNTLDRPAEGLAAAQAAVEFFRREVADGNGRARPSLALALSTAAACMRDVGRVEEAATTIAEAIEAYERLPLRRRIMHSDQVAWARAQSADLLRRLGRYEEVVAAAEEALLTLDTYAALTPAYLPVRALARTNLAVARAHTGQPERARAAAGRAVDDFRRLAGTDRAGYEEPLAWSLEFLAERWAALDRHDEAAGALREAVAIRRSRAADSAEVAEAHALLASALVDLSDALWKLDQRVEATELSGEAAASYRTTAELDSGYELPFVRALRVLADRLADTGRDGEAVLVAREAVAGGRRLAERDPGRRPLLARCLHTLARYLGSRHEHAEAVDASTESIALWRLLGAGDPGYGLDLAWSLHRRSWNLAAIRRVAEAASDIDEAIAIGRRRAGQDPEDYAAFLREAARQRAVAGQLDAAVEALKDLAALTAGETPEALGQIRRSAFEWAHDAAPDAIGQAWQAATGTPYPTGDDGQR